MVRLARHRQAVQVAFERAIGRSGRLAVTGATGWLGATLVEMASRAGLSTDNGRLRAFASKSGHIALGSGHVEPLEALSGAEPLQGQGWVIAHFAALGKERTADLPPAGFLAASTAILDAAMALVSRADRPRVVFASSGAVYGADGQPPALEDEPYGHVKAVQETRLAEWGRTTGTPVTICRVFNVGGPYGNKSGLYALSSLVQAALAGQPLVIHAEGPVLRSYVHVEELMAVLLDPAMALTSDQALPFDSAGTEVIEIDDLARLICARTGLGPARISGRSRSGRPESRYVGAGEVYQAAVRRLSLVPIDLGRIVDDTIDSLATPGR